jgi:hypothetical protein
MPQISGAPTEVNKILEAAYASALKKYPGNKAKASKIAYGALKNAGYEKNAEGKWTKKKKEMSEEIVIDAFKEGEYPQGIFGKKELTEISETYDPENYEAPILIGHLSDPSYKGKSAIPAFGWIGKVKVVGDHLKLVASQFSDELKDFINKGLYKKVSAAFYEPTDASNPTPGKWHLHHLAFLGGTPPAVKGLEGIQFSSVGFPIEMAEMDTEVSVDGDVIDTVEELGEEDTINDLTESCARFISTVTDALESGADYDTVKSRCQLACSDHSNECYNTLNMHWMFTDKLENIEEHQETEMSEKKSILIQFKELFTKRKESKMDAQKEQEYQTKITELQSKVTAFEEAKTAAETAAAEVAKTAAKAAKVSEIKTFCETKIKEGKMTPAMQEKDEPIMVTLIDTPDALKSFQEKYTASVVPLGEVRDVNTQKLPVEDILTRAEKYVKANPAEFKEMTLKEGIRKAILDKKV